MRKYFFIAGLLVIAGLVALYFLFPQEKTVKNITGAENPAFAAVPLKSPFIVEITDFHKLYTATASGNPMIDELKLIPAVNQLTNQLARFEELGTSNPNIWKLLDKKPILISVNPSRKNSLATLFLAPLRNSAEKTEISDLIRKGIDHPFSVSSKTYDNTEVFTAKSDSLTFYFSYNNDIFMACTDAILLDEAVRQSNTSNLLNKSDFRNLYNTVNANSYANIYINHRTFNQLLSRIINPELRKRISGLSNYANWTELDLTFKPNELLINGFSYASDSTDNYLNIFKKQQLQKVTIDAACPINTSYLAVVSLSDSKTFLTDYETYLRAQGVEFYQRQSRLMEIQKQCATNFAEVLLSVTDNEFASAFTTINKSNPEANRFFMARARSISESKEKLLKVMQTAAPDTKNDPYKTKTDLKFDQKNSFEIYKFPFPDFPSVLFGRLFSGIDCNYLTFYQDYLIWGDNLPAMKEYLSNMVRQSILKKDPAYQKFCENLNERTNFYLYANISKIIPLRTTLLKSAIDSTLSTSEESLRKFKSFGWQFSYTNQMFLNNMILKYDPVEKEEPQTVWQSKLDSTLATKPLLVTNHRDPQNKEIITQDQANNLYLINKDGVALWKIDLGEPIISDIQQIDLYRNNKLQYLFNTRSKIYIVDRNGEMVKRFPISLKSKATNGVSALDYDNNRDYRFAVCCEDKNLYLFDRDGKPVSGLKFKGTEHEVTHPVHHVRINKKDYLVFADKYKTYFIDRQGATRLESNQHFEHSGNDLIIETGGKPRVLATDNSGQVQIQYFDGKSETLSFGKFSPNHFFEVADLDGNGISDFIFADNSTLSVFTPDKKKITERKFTAPITAKPNVYSFNKGNKIGVVTAADNHIYLIERNGKDYDGFPLQGQTAFTIGKLNPGNNYLNLIVGDSDGNLLNYRVE